MAKQSDFIHDKDAEREQLVCGYARILGAAFRDKKDFSEEIHYKEMAEYAFKAGEAFADIELKRWADLEEKSKAFYLAAEKAKEDATKAAAKAPKKNTGGTE